MWKLGQVRDTKIGKSISNEELLNAVKYKGYNFYCFWAVKRKQYGGVKLHLPPPLPPTHTHTQNHPPTHTHTHALRLGLTLNLQNQVKNEQMGVIFIQKRFYTSLLGNSI